MAGAGAIPPEISFYNPSSLPNSSLASISSLKTPSYVAEASHHGTRDFFLQPKFILKLILEGTSYVAGARDFFLQLSFIPGDT